MIPGCTQSLHDAHFAGTSDSPRAMSESEIIAATEKLLAAASAGDVPTYASLSAESLTAIEPETQGTVVTGLAFHKHMLNRECIRCLEWNAACSRAAPVAGSQADTIAPCMADLFCVCLVFFLFASSWQRAAAWTASPQQPGVTACANAGA